MRASTRAAPSPASSPLLYRVATLDGQAAAPEAFLADVRAALADVRFARTKAGAEVTVPVTFQPL